LIEPDWSGPIVGVELSGRGDSLVGGGDDLVGFRAGPPGSVISRLAAYLAARGPMTPFVPDFSCSIAISDCLGISCRPSGRRSMIGAFLAQAACASKAERRAVMWIHHISLIDIGLSISRKQLPMTRAVTPDDLDPLHVPPPDFKIRCPAHLVHHRK
jgi:hypothetical protein